MFSTRLRPSDKLFECVVIFDLSDSSRGCHFSYGFPKDYSFKILEERLPQFIFPCEHKSALPDEFTVVFTDIDGKLEFVVCLYLPMTAYAICVKSHRACFEFIHCLLMVVIHKQLYHERSHEELTLFLNWLLSKDIDSPNSSELFSLSYVSGLEYPFVHRHILEYYASLSCDNWIAVFESLLLEHNVIFYSSRFQRLTSCILSSLSLIYPLVWVHLLYPILPLKCIDYIGCPSPFIAGIHSCMAEKIKPMLASGVVLVDLDNDTVYTSDDSNCHLPDVIRQWLIRRCRSSHRLLPYNKEAINDNWEATASLMCQPYLETMALLLGGYREAVYQLQPSDVSSTKTKVDSVNRLTEPVPGTWLFDSHLFVNSRGRECVAYFRRLLRSQMVMQFIESRLDSLNSDVGMVDQDVFEDCITRMSKVRPAGLSSRILGHRNLKMLSDKLASLRIKKSAKPKQLLPRHVPPTSSSLTAICSSLDDTTSYSSSNSVESLDKVGTDELDVSLLLESTDENYLDETILRRANTSNISAADRRSAWLDSYENSSLVKSVFMAIPDIPGDWLKPFPTDINQRQDSEATRAEVPSQSYTPCASHTGEKGQCYQNTTDLLVSFDPYCPVLHTPTPVQQENDLTCFLRQLDPLCASTDEEDLLR